MVNYSYDEGGTMSSYFVLTFLSLVLVPLTISLFTGKTKHTEQGGCQCKPCLENRVQVAKDNRRLGGGLIGPKVAIISVGWAVFAFFIYRVMTTKIESTMYDPYEILGIKRGTAESDIKRHFKKLSIKFHPDKVKLAINETMEMVSARFVEITKAYKSLTNEEIRENWEKYGHPDGKQEYGVGLAIPPWIVEAKNSIWVLGFYGILFGGGLPYVVARWWFGSRSTTKDGVKNKTAEQFFKAIREESGPVQMFAQLAQAWKLEADAKPLPKLKADINLLRDKIDTAISTDYREKVDDPVAERALVLLYAHLLRIPVKNQALADEQKKLLLHTPTLLNSMLSMTLSHSWLGPTLSVMRLHALLAQAMMLDGEKLTAIPGVDKDTAEAAGNDFKKLVEALESKDSAKADVVRKVGEKWAKIEIIDAGYKVIGEKTVTPSAIMQLVFKVRLAPPLASPSSSTPATPDDATKTAAIDADFLSGKKDAEDLPPNTQRIGFAHAPHWPGLRKPSWWAILTDFRTGKVVVPPMRFTDIPLSDPAKKRNYRTYKMQIQAPNQVGMFPWRLLIFSDTYIGEDVGRDLPLVIEQVSEEAAAEVQEDEISDPEEDTLAGQMAAMRGGKVKQRVADDSDDSSDTDGDQAEDSSSDSDSD